MSDWTIGVVSPKAYQYSATFNDVAFALCGGLRDLGHTANLHAVSEDSEVFVWTEDNIVLGGNLIPHYPGINYPLDAWIFNLEQATSPWMGPKYLAFLRRHKVVLDYSERNIEWLRAAGVEAQLCRIGYHPCLTRIDPVASEDELIDVLFYGSGTERRVSIIREMCKLGINVQCLFGCYGPERDRFISRSKIVLNLHAYERSPLEIVRLQLLFANRKCVLTETCAPDDPEYNLYRGCMAEGGNAAQLAAVARNLLADQSLRFRLGQLGHDAFKSRPQAEYLRPLVAAPAPA